MKKKVKQLVIFTILTLSVGFTAEAPPPGTKLYLDELSFLTRKLQEFQKEGWVTIAANTIDRSSGSFIGQRNQTYKVLSINGESFQSREFHSFEDLFGLHEAELHMSEVDMIGALPNLILCMHSKQRGYVHRFVGFEDFFNSQLFEMREKNLVDHALLFFPSTCFFLTEMARSALHIHSLSGTEIERSKVIIPRKSAYQETTTVKDRGGGIGDGIEYIAFLNAEGSERFVCLHNLRTSETIKTPSTILYPFDALLSFQHYTGMNFIISQQMLCSGNHLFLYPEVTSINFPGLAKIINEILNSVYFIKTMARYRWGTSEITKENNTLIERYYSEVSIGKTPITFLPFELDEKQPDGMGIILPIRVELLFSGWGELHYTLPLPLAVEDFSEGNLKDQENYVSAHLDRIMQTPTDIKYVKFVNTTIFKLNNFWLQELFCPYWVLYASQSFSIKKPLIYYIEGGPKAIKGNPAYNDNMTVLAVNGFFVVSANYPGSTFDEKSVDIADGKCLSLSMSYFSSLHEEIMKVYGEFIDTDKIGMIGESYGGTVALMHSFDWKGKLAPNLKACVSRSPQTSYECSQSRYIFGESPILLPSNFAHTMNKPTLLIHGKQDPRCLYNDVKAFVRKVPKSLREQFLTFISVNNMEHEESTDEQIKLSTTCILQFLRYQLNYWEGTEGSLTKLRADVDKIDIHLVNAFASFEGEKKPQWMQNLLADGTA